MTVIKLVYWLIIVPFLLGILVLSGFPKKERTPDRQYLAGFLLMLAVFQLFAVPVVLKESHIDVLVRMTMIVTTVLILGACVLIVSGVRRLTADGKKIKRTGSGSIREHLSTGIYWCLFLGVMVFQLYMAYHYASFDGDDAFYVAQSVMAEQDGSMYEVDPYTGGVTEFDARHATATITMWIAVIAKLTDIHAAILSHTVMPLIIIPVVYLIYLQIGRLLLHSKKDLPIFLLFMAMLQMFGYVSMYTKETFLLTRTWQGKAMAGNIVFPVILWILLYFAQNIPAAKEKIWGYWLVLVCSNIFAAMCSSLAAFLAALMIGSFGLVLAIQKRSLKVLLGLALSCIPCVVYMGLYVVLR